MKERILILNATICYYTTTLVNKRKREITKSRHKRDKAW
jgi:hypothetical protein